MGAMSLLGAAWHLYSLLRKERSSKGSLRSGREAGTDGRSNRASEARTGERLYPSRRPRDTEQSPRASVSRGDR